MKRYQIWDKVSSVITPSGEVFSPEQWANRYPMSMVDGVKLVISGGVLNGAVCMEFTSFIDGYIRQGCDFSDCENDQEVLDTIEAWEDLMSLPVEEDEEEYNPLDSIASSLEFLAISSLPDVE